MKSATKMGDEEGAYEKLLSDDKKAAESDAGDYVDSGEKKKRKIGRFKVLFYVFGVVSLFPMSVFSLCLCAIVASPGLEKKYGSFFLAMIMSFYTCSKLGGTLLCEAVTSLNSSSAPELIDFAGIIVCSLTTWGFHYASQLCLFLISESTPGIRFTAAGYLVHGADVFTLLSAILTVGFALCVFHLFICCYNRGFDAVVGGVQIDSYRRRGGIAKDIFTFLVICIACAILDLIRRLS